MNVQNLSAKAAIRVRRTPSEVFGAFADASAMSRFWFARRDDGLREGVAWSFEETANGDRILTIEESGFTGSSEAILDRVMDSTGGFNQVVVAAKALIEHGVELDVVADHA